MSAINNVTISTLFRSLYISDILIIIFFFSFGITCHLHFVATRSLDFGDENYQPARKMIQSIQLAMDNK